MASSSRLKPGEKGRISIAVDVKGKMGNIMKTITVHTNDPGKQQIMLYLSMNIKDQMHMNKFAPAEIFSNQCRSCHIERGTGKKGPELFNADCLMCHNYGKSALPIPEMRKKSRKYITSAIAEGLPDTAMPGWNKKNNGPLSDEEIESLVDLIKPAKLGK